MADGLVAFLEQTLHRQAESSLATHIQALESANFAHLFSQPLARELLGHDQGHLTKVVSFSGDWARFLASRAQRLAQDHSDSNWDLYTRRTLLVILGIAALNSFLQANVTGPPLDFAPEKLLISDAVLSNRPIAQFRHELRASLSQDGEAAYRLTPFVELLVLAKAIFSTTDLITAVLAGPWAKLRADLIHQRVLAESSPFLQNALDDGIRQAEDLFSKQQDIPDDIVSCFLLEKATVYAYYGQDVKLRQALDEAARLRHFEFTLTGALGKRTRFQERDISQLVLLAQSTNLNGVENGQNEQEVQAPAALPLNDDTLLESISFIKSPGSTEVVDSSQIPPSLAGLDANDQPQLHPLDSIILLSLAASITNTSPSDGLTREETAPYAERVLAGGSSNWQVYTQALLLRSRIEGYRSRTTERGLLQLQALVDQVIAETATESSEIPSITVSDEAGSDKQQTTFLPRASASESAPASARLLYIYPLASSTRWELEAELAARWVSLGGLRSALEIYERLEMWAEAALCWAATDREDKAREIVRNLLYDSSGKEREPPPLDAPRLYSILGDIDHDLAFYEKAWTVSNQKYARAQRSIARYWFSQSVKLDKSQRKSCLEKSAAAYDLSLKVNRLHGPSWFAFGCALLELEEFEQAAEAFGRTVQLDEGDAEAWSNLAAALLKKGPDRPEVVERVRLDDDDDEPQTTPLDDQKNVFAALSALRKAASVKHDSARIWDNLLTVAFSTSPPAWTDALTAQRRVIELRAKADGEECIDVSILEACAREVMATPYFLDKGAGLANPSAARGTPKMFLDLLDLVEPMISTTAASPRLWQLVANVREWQGRPADALAALEKAWRAALAGEWAEGGGAWATVGGATLALCEGYERLGGGGGAADGRFKARSALRSVLGKARAALEGDAQYAALQARLEELKG